MWSQVVLFLLVGLAYASNNPAGWKENQEYIYKVRGRVMTGLWDDDSNQYSGFLLKADLRIQPRANGKLQAMLVKPEVSPVHDELTNGWQTYIPDEKLTWKPLPMSQRPFQIHMEKGKIVNLVVSRHVQNHEANMLKGLISPLQLSIDVENAIPSHLNILPDEQSNNAVYVVTEDTVSGETETLYQIKDMPPHLVQSSEHAEHIMKLKLEGDVIEVLKHKNFTNAEDLPAYSFGFHDYISGDKPGDTTMGRFLSRDATGHAVLVGDLKRYTVINSTLVNTILVNPTITDQQKSVIISAVSVSLTEIKSQNKQIDSIPDPLELGSLVYSAKVPVSGDETVSGNKRLNERIDDDDEYSSSYDRLRYRRSLEQKSIYDKVQELDSTLEDPDISEAPGISYAHLTTGYEGKSMKNNVQTKIVKLAKEIGSELENSEKDHHEETLEKFVNLVTLIRLMNFEELKRISEQLRIGIQDNQEKAAQTTFRDGVAAVGTGPALLLIDSWIVSRKIENAEAAQVIATMAKSARYPTVQYMRTFFKLTKKEQVVSQWPLNDTALVNFAHLARTVYVNKETAEVQFPMLAFGPFRTAEGIRFITEEVIPHYTQELKKAIERDESQKVHAYTRALGNIAHPKMLAAYEPYLEGDKQASQFQRLLMVLSLDKIVMLYPEEILSVAYRIYQNTGEHPAVRVASVFLIMRARPTTEILQVMAQNTHIETNEHVNAAVKQAIEELSEMEGPVDTEIRENAQAARPHLTNKNYGVNYGGHYLRNHVMDELNLRIQFSGLLIPSEDKYVPRGMRVSAHSSYAGLYRQQFNILAIVSNLEQLINVGWMQTKKGQEQVKEQKQHAQQQAQYPWSSQRLANVLDMQIDEREQLEGLISLEMGTPLTMYSYNNATMEQLPEYIRKWEQELKKGKQLTHYKLAPLQQIELVIPTVLGVPAVYSLESPLLFKSQGQIIAAANPQLSQDDLIQKPDQIKIEAQVRVTVSGKTQGRLIVLTPLEHKQYISGYDKHWELNLPKINAEVKVDLTKQELKAVIKPKEERNVRLMHLRTWPYTAISDITNTQPLSSQDDMKIVKPKNMQGFKTIVGEKSTGIALEVEVNHERKPLNLVMITRALSNKGLSALVNGLSELWEDNNIQNSQLDITYLPQQSSVRQINIASKYDQEYQQSAGPREQKWTLNENADQAERQRELMKEVSGGIKNVQVVALDNVVELVGDKNIRVLLTGAAAKSNVDPKSRLVVSFKRTSESSDVKDYEAHVFVRNVAENTNGMDVDYSMETEPVMETEIDTIFGFSKETLSKLRAKLQHTRSEERKNYLKELPMAKQCKQEMREGNKALDACTQMNMVANLLDRVQIKIEHENISPKVKEAIKMAYEAGRFHLLPSLEIKQKQSPLSENEILMNVRFHEDLEYLNATLQIQDEETMVKNIELNEIVQQIIVPHPVFNVRARLMSQLHGIDSYRDFCTVDRSKVVTFSNMTYDAKVADKWTLVALYAPRHARYPGQEQQEESVQKQLRSQPENIAIMVRQNKESQNKKDVKIVLSTPETNFEIVDIEMTPSRENKLKAQVSVNKRPTQISKQQSQDLHKGFIQMYALPNGEVKVEIAGILYTIFDGERVRLTAVSDKLKDATRGLCGQFNDQSTDDLLSSVNCIARNPKKFVKSLEVEGEEGKQIRQQFDQEDNDECVEKVVPLYANVISASDVSPYDSDDDDNETQQNRRRPTPSWNQGTRDSHCLIEQTRYVQDNGKICFTTRPIPACRNTCQQRSSRRKQVGVHCVEKSNVVELWKKQIDDGGSPDFSNKKDHKTASISVAESCSL